MSLENYIRDIQGFPKQGILYKDITPLLINPKARSKCLEILVSTLKDKKIDKVVGVESRGFFFGMLIAHELNVGFVPVRKAKKLPYKTISATYDLEYRTDTLEIHIDAIQKVDRILIHDDVLASGDGKSSMRINRKVGRRNCAMQFSDGTGFPERKKKN